MYALSLAAPTAPASLRPSRRLSDDEVVGLVAALVRDPRAWIAAELGAVAPDQTKDAARRAVRLLREALATV